MKASTMRELLVQAEENWGEEIVIRYKSGKGTVAEKSYMDLRKDSEHFSDLLETLKVRGGHVALIGPTSYEWILSYFGTVNSGSVAVPLDVSLPAADPPSHQFPVPSPPVSFPSASAKPGCHLHLLSSAWK